MQENLTLNSPYGIAFAGANGSAEMYKWGVLVATAVEKLWMNFTPSLANAATSSDPVFP